MRSAIQQAFVAEETDLLRALAQRAALTGPERQGISAVAASLVEAVRARSEPGVMESFLAEYGLTTNEGVALMCLAEALLRVPDDTTVDELIRDKIAPHNWASHVGDSGSILINASTWALLLTGKVLDETDPGVVGVLQGVMRRLGEPVVRVAARRAMQEMGSQFVLGEDIVQATRRGNAMVARGYTYSYDMLGEAARTEADAQRYFQSYADAINALSSRATSSDLRNNPGISVKLSALHARYETLQAARTVPAVSDRLLQLAKLARDANIGLNVDAEEANRLELSLDVIEQVLSSTSLGHWDGFGVVVQAYGKRAPMVLDWLIEKSEALNRRLMVRLVKGAYWDTEVKLAQVMGLSDYPVFTRKTATDVSYIGCARRLLDSRDRLYPQFATHNAHTIAAVIHMAGRDHSGFEFQRLHGMGEALHDIVLTEYQTRCRIYAPVGAHRDLLAYLVRRLLENGANSSFVNQIVDESVSAQKIATDPFSLLEQQQAGVGSSLIRPPDLYQPQRINSAGFDINEPGQLAQLVLARKPFLAPYQWRAPNPTREGSPDSSEAVTVINPANPADVVGVLMQSDTRDVSALIASATAASTDWQKTAVSERARILNRAGDLFEQNRGEILALLAREAGKTLTDAVAELREAVDFLRYYGAMAPQAMELSEPRGVIACISPWNFPLAIFTGQIAAALVTGNTVIAKPAEQSGLIAWRAVQWFHEAGIAQYVLQLAAGPGETVGAALTAQPKIAGVCFTGSTQVAKLIERQLAKTAAPDTMLIAETGGLNAMVVDSTALPEQAVRDIVTSAFQSAGQRCSALRMLYVQQEKSAELLRMLTGAMQLLRVGDPLDIATDVGPLIDVQAHHHIGGYCQTMQRNGQVLATTKTPASGYFCAPTLVQVDGIDSLGEEIFGPVLHVATFKADQLDQVVSAINQRGYGLTLGLHTRIDERADRIVNTARVGNIYINRNQIGAVVGSQPFGGEGLSGTGPKAGGPHYLSRFTRATSQPVKSGAAASRADQPGKSVSCQDINAAFAALPDREWARAKDKIGILRSVLRGRAAMAMAAAAALDLGPVILPGPTGESNRLSLHPLGRVLCLSPWPDQLLADVAQALRGGNAVVAVAPDAVKTLAFLQVPGVPLAVLDGQVSRAQLERLDVDAVAIGADHPQAGQIRQALAAGSGKIVRLITESIDPARFVSERAVCIDTTAAGGNAQLLASSA